ncbi:MAG: conjugal transfer protein TraX [Clostridiales bacterium]|nr:conjugal transfer protein TraX [Clostridiales bacterium]
MINKGLSSNALKFIAIIAMTIDHVICVTFPNYPTDWWIVALHMIGRITAPIMWFFVAEGYHYTHNLKKYIVRLFIFAVISHFAYNFAFGIPFIPFRTSVFNQTSVIWSLAWGLVALAISDSVRLKQWQKTVLIIIICTVTFCSDWSCIAVLAIVGIGSHRGDFKRQMTEMMMYVFFYALIYFIFINKIYGIIQLFVALSIPLLKSYNGKRGSWKGMKWFFYFYYPAHLVLCGIIRILLYGNIGVMIGG